MQFVELKVVFDLSWYPEDWLANHKSLHLVFELLLSAQCREEIRQLRKKKCDESRANGQMDGPFPSNKNTIPFRVHRAL